MGNNFCKNMEFRTNLQSNIINLQSDNNNINSQSNNIDSQSNNAPSLQLCEFSATCSTIRAASFTTCADGDHEYIDCSCCNSRKCTKCQIKLEMICFSTFDGTRNEEFQCEQCVSKNIIINCDTCKKDLLKINNKISIWIGSYIRGIKQIISSNIFEYVCGKQLHKNCKNKNHVIEFSDNMKKILDDKWTCLSDIEKINYVLKYYKNKIATAAIFKEKIKLTEIDISHQTEFEICERLLKMNGVYMEIKIGVLMILFNEIIKNNDIIMKYIEDELAAKIINEIDIINYICTVVSVIYDDVSYKDRDAENKDIIIATKKIIEKMIYEKKYKTAKSLITKLRIFKSLYMNTNICFVYKDILYMKGAGVFRFPEDMTDEFGYNFYNDCLKKIEDGILYKYVIDDILYEEDIYQLYLEKQIIKKGDDGLCMMINEMFDSETFDNETINKCEIMMRDIFNKEIKEGVEKTIIKYINHNSKHKIMNKNIYNYKSIANLINKYIKNIIFEDNCSVCYDKKEIIKYHCMPICLHCVEQTLNKKHENNMNQINKCLICNGV